MTQLLTNNGGMINPLFDGLKYNMLDILLIALQGWEKYYATCKISMHIIPKGVFIFPLLRHFTILGQKNTQNMPRYYTVEQGKNTD